MKTEGNRWAKGMAAVLLGMMGLVILGIGICLAVAWDAGYLLPGLLAGAAGLVLCAFHLPAQKAGVRENGMES